MTTDKHEPLEMETEPGFDGTPKMDIEEHSYDGIQELDNPPPGWIMAIFYVTIAMSIFYAAYYFWFNVGDQQDAEYASAVKKYEEKYKPQGEQGALSLLSDEASLTAGATIYKEMNCAACHGMAAEGNAIGPNLTDEFWIHGCKFDEIFNSIKNGYPAKGMTAFKTQLTDEKLAQVTSYVVSLKGSNPANAKAAQGEKCE
jgi:cytochrome c oxidase cbb3-type subunit 3